MDGGKHPDPAANSTLRFFLEKSGLYPPRRLKSITTQGSDPFLSEPLPRVFRPVPSRMTRWESMSTCDILSATNFFRGLLIMHRILLALLFNLNCPGPLEKHLELPRIPCFGEL